MSLKNLGKAVGLLLLLGMLSTLLTGLYYDWGEGVRMEQNKDLVLTTLAVTHPNIIARPSTLGHGFFFDASVKLDLVKQIGGEEEKAGWMTADFFLDELTAFDWGWESDYNSPESAFYDAKHEPSKGWEMLKKVAGRDRGGGLSPLGPSL